MDVEMKIRGLDMDPSTHAPIVILKDLESDTVLPIWVGLYEPNVIALEIEKATTPRPQTHDLLRNLVTGLNATVERVVVTELRNDTFYAVVWMRQGGESGAVAAAARPPDGLPLPLACDCPIYLSEEVLRIPKLAPGARHPPPGGLPRWLE